MKRTKRLFIFCLLLVVAIASIFYSFRELDFGNSLPANFPKNIPIVSGEIVSCKTARSDDLVRVLEVRIETGLPFEDVVEFYRDDFQKNATEMLDNPAFQISSAADDTSSVAMYGKNTVGVFIHRDTGKTEVLVQVRGVSIFRLPE